MEGLPPPQNLVGDMWCEDEIWKVMTENGEVQCANKNKAEMLLWFMHYKFEDRIYLFERLRTIEDVMYIDESHYDQIGISDVFDQITLKRMQKEWKEGIYSQMRQHNEPSPAANTNDTENDLGGQHNQNDENENDLNNQNQNDENENANGPPSQAHITKMTQKGFWACVTPDRWGNLPKTSGEARARLNNNTGREPYKSTKLYLPPTELPTSKKYPFGSHTVIQGCLTRLANDGVLLLFEEDVKNGFWCCKIDHHGLARPFNRNNIEKK
eukprot:945210_1